MLLSRFASFFSKHFSTGRPLKSQRRGGKGTEKEWEKWRSVSYSGPASPLQQRGTPRLLAIPRPLGTHLSGALPLYFTVTGDILVSRCHDEMAPLPRRSPRRRNQWNNEVPRSWGWNSGGPSWVQRPNPSPSPAPMKSGISRSVADDKSVSVCPRLFPGPGEDPGWGETETQIQRPRDGSFGGHQGQPACTALTSDPSRDQTVSYQWHCGRVNRVLSLAGLAWVSRRDSSLTAMLFLRSLQVNDALNGQKKDLLLWKWQQHYVCVRTKEIIYCTRK